MNTASKGRRLEHDIRHLFEREGYAVMRGAGSKGLFDSLDGTVKPDLIATKADRMKRTVQIILLQCKVAG